MEFRDIANKVEENKKRLQSLIASANLSEEERNSLQKSIDNYDYILEITEIGHHSNGTDVY